VQPIAPVRSGMSRRAVTSYPLSIYEQVVLLPGGSRSESGTLIGIGPWWSVLPDTLAEENATSEDDQKD
jgi:hypothetical protein